MPHTNRRKKNTPAKRLEVTDDDGWTTVTTTNQMYWKRRPKPTFVGILSSEEAESFWKSTPEKGATIDKVTLKWEKAQEQWKASESCRTLLSLLQERVLREDVEVDRCFIFGSGSFCGSAVAYVHRNHVALHQLAVIKSIQSTIGEQHGCCRRARANATKKR